MYPISIINSIPKLILHYTYTRAINFVVLEDPYLNDGLACRFNTIGVGHGMDVVGVGLVQVEYVSILPQHFQVDSISLQSPHPLLPWLRALR